MRITNNMMVNTLMSNLTRNMNRMSLYQDRLATGKQVIRASDDPVATSGILKYKSDIASLAQYEKNTGDSMAWMEITESSVADTGEVLQRMRELAVQAANGTNTVDDTKKIAAEIEQMKKHLISNGNASFAGRYCFTGYQTDIPLLKEDGTYNIDITQADLIKKPTLEYQVSIAQEIEVTTNGIDIYGVHSPAAPYIMESLLPTDAVNRASTSTNGIAATKGTLTRSFPLDQDYTAQNLDVTIGGTTYNVDESLLNGSTGTPLSKELILKQYEDSGVLAVADVFFDAGDQLVVKTKAFGPVAISGAVPYVATVGNNTTEASITGTTLLPAAFTAAEEAAIKADAFFITINGERKRIQIPATATVTTAAQFVTALQGAIDDPNAFGPGKVVVSGAAGTGVTLTTAGTVIGEKPIVRTDYIVAKESQMMVDINNFLDGLNGVTGALPVADFLGKIDVHLNQLLAIRADIGARVNRMELVADRISDNTISFTKMLSDVQDADMAGVIMYLKNAENVYKAALSTGSKVIQPSLIDFLN